MVDSYICNPVVRGREGGREVQVQDSFITVSPADHCSGSVLYPLQSIVICWFGPGRAGYDETRQYFLVLNSFN